MNLTDRRNWLSGLIGLVVVLIVVWTKPVSPAQPFGIILPAQTVLPSTTVDQVAVLRSLPGSYQVLGRINIERNVDAMSQQAAVGQIITKAKQLATTVGANAMVIDVLGQTPGGTVGAKYIMYARALHIQVRFPMMPGIVLPAKKGSAS